MLALLLDEFVDPTAKARRIEVAPFDQRARLNRRVLFVVCAVNQLVSKALSLDLVRNLPGKSWANNAEFKYFKRDYLEPAVNQINELSDIEMSYETRAGTPGSRKKDQIRFRLKRKEGALASKAAMLNSVVLFKMLQDEFGLSDKQFEKIAENRSIWTDECIQQAIDYTRWTIRQGTKVKRASAYLMRDSFRQLSSIRSRQAGWIDSGSAC